MEQEQTIRVLGGGFGWRDVLQIVLVVASAFAVWTSNQREIERLTTQVRQLEKDRDTSRVEYRQDLQAIDNRLDQVQNTLNTLVTQLASKER